MRLSSIALGATLGLFATACITPYDIEPATGGSVGSSSGNSLTMRVNPNAWRGHPFDLDSYLTPLSIELTSQHTGDVWISYADFALVDEWGVRYRAITPYFDRAQRPTRATPPPAPVKLPPPAPALKPLPPAAAPQLPSPVQSMDEDESLDDTWRQIYDRQEPISRRSTSGQIMLVDYQPQAGGTFEPLLSSPANATPTPRARRGVGRGQYGPFVDPWDERYYPDAPSYDVIRLGLTEGMLSKGDHVTGFVYFQNATSHPGRLTLTWTAHTPEGWTVESLTVPMTIEEDQEVR